MISYKAQKAAETVQDDTEYLKLQKTHKTVLFNFQMAKVATGENIGKMAKIGH